MIDPLAEGDPQQIGPYRLHGRLGGGGMGRVFLGRSPGGWAVAVKVVHPELAGDPEFRRRFAAEVAAARRVGGFYTAQVVAADTGAERPWLATAYIPGPSLEEAVRDDGPLPPEAVAALGAGLAEGLAAIHAQGLVHRDLKPANVILGEDGPRIIDFGIARALDAASHTRTGTVVGTAGFMSPEQARGEETRASGDVFSLGSLLAFAATGRSPFGAGSAPAVGIRIVNEPPDLAGVSGGLARVIGDCLAKAPEDRPEVGDVLDRLSGADAAEGPARWLPSAVTTVITERRTAVLSGATRVLGPPRPPRAARPARRRAWTAPPWQAFAALLVVLALLWFAAEGLTPLFPLAGVFAGTPYAAEFGDWRATDWMDHEHLMFMALVVLAVCVAGGAMLARLTTGLTALALAPVAAAIGGTVRAAVLAAVAVVGLVAPVYVIAGVVPLLLDRVPPQVVAWAAGAVVLVALAIASGWYGEARTAIARGSGAVSSGASGTSHAALGRAAESAVSAWRTAVADSLKTGTLIRRDLAVARHLVAIVRDLGAVVDGLRAGVENAAADRTEPLYSTALVSVDALTGTAKALDTAVHQADRLAATPLVVHAP
ncbi:serine/threonine-protein kinase [Nocardiopsis trehalosi]|jgi:hypothetical protein|uniref:serine/threonine-protein kinase n=1 Tax=Nocardiopsis trehalosi TaxID=109329 RepID=UPI00082E98A9|nr:serine/threonine-protein kinase [Nocardiopsis trehalosi]